MKQAAWVEYLAHPYLTVMVLGMLLVAKIFRPAWYKPSLLDHRPASPLEQLTDDYVEGRIGVEELADKVEAQLRAPAIIGSKKYIREDYPGLRPYSASGE